METIEVYVIGDAHTPARFWDYALRTNYKQASGGRMYIDLGFQYSQTDTDLYKSLTEEEKKKVKFLYINGINQLKINK
jgi:hypothetical protein